ncbi:serine-protein kinase ATM isoform X2 [Cydia pomonella]|uniref:serine-protein kinase ATM isoform X2 n=1 Tax=Cydia pomonella TaxID=82600 RepID=UPI002ADDCC9E|nr:serine-protein kinase ATM isoform X2 [Cydia pomonella]
MSLENSLQEIGAGLISTRANERKKNAESLKNFLTGNAVPALLSSNTIKKKGYNWNNVFDDVHEYILKELEKYETSKTFFNVTAPLCTSLLHLCLAGSNKGQAYISCEKVMEACLFVLKDKRMATAIGDAYLQLLYKHVLPYEHYVSFITPATWEDLLEISVKSSFTNHTQLDSYTLLRLICSVVKKAASCTQFVVPLRDALPLLKKCFHRIESDKKNQESVTEITTILLEKLSSEGRLAMCEFTESTLPLLLKYYDQNADQKKKASVFKVLHLIVHLHHPEGKQQGENGSLAYNWNIWNKYLNSIMEITCLEANYLQKLRKHNDSTQYYEYYYTLAASVYFQILNMPSQSADETINSSKRQRISLNNYKCFSDLIDELRTNHMPWLGIICSYIQDFGAHVTAPEYVVLLGVAESLVSNNNMLNNWNIFEQFASLILKNIVDMPGNNEILSTEPLVALWNSCVRNSSSVNDAHKAIHTIMQTLLEMYNFEFQTVQPLLKLYFEKGMPVTDASIKTLCCVHHKYYSKCSNEQDRKRCLAWLFQGNISSLEVKRVRHFFLRIIANENFSFKERMPKKHKDPLYEILFNSLKDTLFSIGDLDITKEKKTSTNVLQSMEINNEIAGLAQEYLQGEITSLIEKLNRREIGPFEFIQYARVVIAYIDITLQISPVIQSHIEESQLYICLKTGLKTMSRGLAKMLKESKDARDEINMLQCMQNVWLADYHPIVDCLVRSCADHEFFASINEILSVQQPKHEDEYENDSDYNPNATKHNCIWLLAAYCRKSSEYRDDIFELILDPALYELTSSWDVKCAFQCVRILIDESVEQCPFASVFSLLSNMCRALFRNSEATETILHILLDILDRVWTLDNNMKQNCFIMVKGYLQRCEKLYYPPHVAALIFKCVARMAELNKNNNNDMGNVFRDALMNQMKGITHSLRLYTCYLLDVITNNLTDTDIEAYFTGLLEIFVINVSDTNEQIIKDESTNRTLTVLHNFLALAQAKHSSIHRVITGLLLIKTEKLLDTSLVKTFLSKITKSVTCGDIDAYLDDNILSVIHFWTSKNKKIEELPFEVLGFQNVDSFLEKHMKWVIAADILWNNEGDVIKSHFLNKMKQKLRKSEKSIIEMCFPNIIVLCLPYIVTEKYSLNFSGPDQYAFLQSTKHANKMFKTTQHILDNDKWSYLFVETMPELLLMGAMHLRDQEGTEKLFGVNVAANAESYLYPKAVFSSILRYFGELTDGNIMQYLCSEQATTIFDILLKLWENVLQTKIFEFRVQSFYTFITFVECIPLGFDSDAFVANFTCNHLTHAIKSSTNKNELRVLIKSLKIVLTRLLPQSADLIRKPMLKALSVLLIKKEEGFDKECDGLLKYLADDMKDNLRQNEDVIDFSNASHGVVLSCASRVEFSERLKAYSFTLTCPSHEALSNLRQFVKLNKHHVNNLCEELNTKHFSEECSTSVIHQVIYALTNIMKSSSDDKIIIEACNCLADIGTYDLKTIVTVPPPDTKRVIHLPPKQSFAFAVVAILSEVLCDENPAAINRAVGALSDLFKYREGKDALELGDANVQLLKPFLSPNSDSDNAVYKLSSRKLENCSDEGFWVPRDKEDHIQWLERITIALLDVLVSDTNYLKTLKDVCKIKPTICQHILPGLVGLLLYSSPESHIQIFSEQINNFFKFIWNMNFDDELENSSERCNRSLNVIGHDRKMIIRYMIDIVNFVRLQRTHYKSRPDRTPVDALNYLRLDYDKVAWAASVADQNLVAIYYGELWAVAQNDGVPPPSPERTTNLDGGENIQRIFRKCFVSIGEMDAVDGCGTAHLTSEEEKRNHLINTGQYSDALLSHDIALSGSPSTDLQLGVVRSLYKSGLHHLALQYIKSLPENDQLNDVKYDCFTCLGDWNHFVDTKDLEEKSKTSMKTPLSLIKALRYSCLKDCLNVQAEQNLGSKLTLPLDRAKLAVSKWCQNFNMENCQNVYRVVANLQLFNDIEEYFLVRSNKLTINSLLSNWKIEKLPSFHDFKHLESLISQRSLILEHAGKNYNTFLKDIVSLQLQYVELGLSNGRLQMAQRLLSVAKNLQNSDAVSLVESRVSWAKGHREIALSLIRMMGDRTDDIELNAASLRQYGMWMAESKFDNPRDIINKFLKKSLDVLAGSDHRQTRLKVYHDIAKFADSEYKQVVSYMNSSIFEHKLKCMESMKDAADSLRTTSTQQQLTRDEKKYLATTRGLSNLDEADIANTKAEKQRYLQLAMRYYLLSLKYSEDNNLSVFRVISLWLANPSLELDAEGDSFEELLRALPSRKFLAALPQLAPRLAQETGAFAENLNNILKRCAKEHPHHTLPILFSLKNSDKDMRILNASRHAAGDALTTTQEPPEPRVGAAEALVAAMAAESSALAKIIAQMELMCDATISFANYKTKEKTQKQKIPSAELIHRLGRLDALPVPIDTIPVRHDCNYSYLPTIDSFENSFELVGGINCPKKIICRSSDGRRRIVLVKGEDDLRQDAVMQQVFNIVNTLLERNSVTSRNKLLIRTYKVVPMSRQSGVLEWCEGTLPLGAYLTGTTGAHARYRPKDISCTAARAKFTTIQNGRRTLSEKLSIFMSILKNFKPVFHNFFTEQYLDPVTWYERRLAYTKSVATSSMMGYILGLGDRHVQNILIDKNTAEVVHIDFGIAFDQGKALPTPETIPFRLTQDMIAGFGSSGVEGIFRKSCEKTMQLLRDNHETLLTILEVLLCDPLYAWTTKKFRSTQKDANVARPMGPVADLAERALLAVGSKLHGTEGGAAGGVAVPGQVARLVRCATDPANLCRLYHGWQPYL